MKSILALVVALLVSAGTATAQTTFGVKAGLNLANLSISEADDTFEPENRTGFVAGVFATFRGGGIFAFQPEALISMQGAKFSDGTDSGTAKIDYFQVPLLARIGPSNVGIVVGPSFGYRIRAKLSAAGLSTEDEDFSDQIKRMDVGLVAGLTADVGRLVLDGRYTWGLTNIEEEATADKTKNRVISLTLGLRF
jgi:hypothetical protein